MFVACLGALASAFLTWVFMGDLVGYVAGVWTAIIVDFLLWSAILGAVPAGLILLIGWVFPGRRP